MALQTPLRCVMCRRPVPDDDLSIIGELPMHRGCEQAWLARNEGFLGRCYEAAIRWDRMLADTAE